MKMKRNLCITQTIAVFVFMCCFTVFVPNVTAQVSKTTPAFWVMPGHATANAAKVWVQTPAGATVYLWIDKRQIGPLQTTAETGYTAIFEVYDLQPNMQYDYWVQIGQQTTKPEVEPHGKLHTAPLVGQAVDFSFVAGSCALTLDGKYKPGKQPQTPNWKRFQIYETIVSHNPDLMLWLGDNIYTRGGEWNSLAGYQYRYSCTRRVHEMQKLLRNANHYAVWDDHDFGPNNADVSFLNKHLGRQAFMQFWPNPDFGLPNEKGLASGITTKFSWGDCDFFCLDSRTFRTPPGDPIQKIDSDQNESAPLSTMLGTKQLQWLLDELKASKATFKFVLLGTQILNTKVGSVETYKAHYPEERQAILDFISANKIANVVFLTGDRHHTDFSVYRADDQSPYIYDLTSSALTSFGSPASWAEKNLLRVPGTFYRKPNFALLEVQGQGDSRQLVISIRNRQDDLVWQQTISAATGTLTSPPPASK